MPTIQIERWSLGHEYEYVTYITGQRHSTNLWSGLPDSANGYTLRIAYRIIGADKTINYVDIDTTACDRVGGVALLDTGHAQIDLHCVGPFQSGDLIDREWEHIWYTPECPTPRFNKATLIYNDNTTEEVPVEVIKNFNDTDYWNPKPKESKGSSNKYWYCYVATCVYGSYDCPEVWTLRRFRDYTLRNSWYGRLFIKMYYAISPKIISIWGDNPRFKAFWKKRLDKIVHALKERGTSDTPYIDW